MDNITASEFTITVEYFDSVGIKCAYVNQPDIRFREVAWNGQGADKAITLYEAGDGSYFATTNADPIWEEDFRQLGACTINAAAVMVYNNLEDVNTHTGEPTTPTLVGELKGLLRLIGEGLDVKVPLLPSADQT